MLFLQFSIVLLERFLKESFFPGAENGFCDGFIVDGGGDFFGEDVYYLEFLSGKILIFSEKTPTIRV